MSANLKRILELAGLIAALLTAIAGFARSYYVTPVKIEELGKGQAEIRADVEKMRDARASDHDLLQRIDERTAATQRDIQELKARRIP